MQGKVFTLQGYVLINVVFFRSQQIFRLASAVHISWCRRSFRTSVVCRRTRSAWLVFVAVFEFALSLACEFFAVARSSSSECRFGITVFALPSFTFVVAERFSVLAVAFAELRLLTPSSWSFASFFALGLEVLSFLTASECLELAIEQLILAELTLQSTVYQAYFHAWLKSYLVETLIAVAQYPRIVACESMFQSFTNHLVQTKQVVR